MKHTRKKGFTLPELLAVVAIIAILSAILVPTLSQRIDKARTAAALQDMKELAQAQETCSAIFGYYVALRVLNAYPATRVGVSPRPDGEIQQYNNTYLIDPNRSVDDQLGDQRTLQDLADTYPTAMDFWEKWPGPFINFQRFHGKDDETIDARFDSPLDPWGSPYRLFSPIGITGDPPEATNYSIESFDDARLTTTDDYFGRYAIVSFGKNREFEIDSFESTEGIDDLFYTFGRYTTETVYRPRF